MREGEAPRARENEVRTLPAGRSGDAASAPGFVGVAPAVRRLREQLEAVAQLRCPVLLTGERGAGRARAARWLHARRDPRAPFLALRGLPPREGEPLGGATVFAPRIDDAPLAVQAAWRVWIARQPANARVLASAASAFPGEGADPGLFAELRRCAVAIPPLRDRRDDFAALAAHMAEEAAQAIESAPPVFSPGAVSALRRAPFLATAADLQRAVERLVAHARPGETVNAALASAVVEALRPSVAALRERALCSERDALLAALEEAGGNLARAARRLGRSRAAVYRLLAKHGIALVRR